MKIIYQIISAVGLAMLLVPSILFFLGNIEPEPMKNYMFIGTMLWFAGAIPWLGRKKKEI